MNAADKEYLRQRAAALANCHRLRSGWVPLQAETQRLREMASELDTFLPQMTEDIGEADREVERLQQALRQAQSRRARLAEQRARMRDQVGFCLALAAPIRRLPNEILVAVFTYVLEDPAFYVEDLRVLATVCYAWRNIMLSTSSLWSTITIGLTTDKEHPYDMQHHSAFVHAQLRRSANRLLSVSLLIQACDDTLVSELWAAAREESYRWRHLTIRTDDVDAYAAFWEDHSSICLPMLETLEFNDVACSPPFDVFGDAPRLRHLSVDTAFEPWDTDFPQSWRLTTLRLHNTLASNCLSALKGSRSTLKEFSIGYMDLDANDPQHEFPSVTLPLLEKLSISGSAANRIGRQLVLPSVHHLFVGSLHTESEGEDVLSIIQRSSANVTTLELMPFLRSQQAVRHLLKGLPTVTHLMLSTHFDRSGFHEGFFRDLTPSADNPDCPLPNLQRLTAELGRTRSGGEISMVKLLPLLQDLRSEEKTVGEQTYPALLERTISGVPGDALFASGSDTEDDDYNSSDENSEALESDADSDCLTEESDEL
ncbi:hypothetical protein K523DRAFT_416845 [Schizophyllum commune Tattone D]|nr:hypothetical protein K523DRAFT_416845 [Schizophyllum commune Tattone D]